MTVTTMPLSEVRSDASAKVVRCLEDALESAKRGEIVTVAYVLFTDDAHIIDRCVGEIDLYQIAGALDALKLRLLIECDDSVRHIVSKVAGQ